MHRHRRLALLILAIAAPVAPEESGVVPALTESGKHIDWYCGSCPAVVLNESKSSVFTTSASPSPASRGH